MATVFQYLTPAEYAERDLSVSGITNATLAEKHISAAERMVDAYCRGWECFYPELTGTVLALPNSTTVSGSVFGNENPGYWAVGGLYLKVVDGAAAGAERLIVGSAESRCTITSGITGLAAGDRFVLKQKSVFPRGRDYDGELPEIPEGIKQAVAAQVAFAVQQGSEAFGQWAGAVVLNEKAKLTGESYGSGYSYQQDPSQSRDPGAQFLAPQARLLLRRFRSSTGRIMQRRRR